MYMLNLLLDFESAKQGGEMQSDVGTSTTGSIKTAGTKVLSWFGFIVITHIHTQFVIDSESAMRVGKIQLEDEFTGTSTTGSIKTAGMKEVLQTIEFHFYWR